MKRICVLYLLLIPLIANAGFLSGRYGKLMANSGVEIYCQGILVAEDGKTDLHPITMTFVNDKDGILVKTECKENEEYNRSVFFPKQSSEYDKDEYGASSANMVEYRIKSNVLKKSFSFIYVSPRECYLVLAEKSDGKSSFIFIRPTFFIRKLGGTENLLKDCSGVETWFQFVTELYKNQ